jgi:hypothetical protein
VAIPLGTREVGGAVVKVTLIAVVLIVMPGVLALTLLLSATVAVMTTAEVGTAEGAVYVTAVPLAVLLALNVPHAPAAVLPQAADQFAPLESFVMVAVTKRVALAASEVGVVLREIDGVVVPPPPPPPELFELHATRAAIILRLIRRRVDLQELTVRDVIAHLR